MNKSNFEHAAIAVTIQVISALANAAIYAADFRVLILCGGLTGVSFYVGREFTQYQTRVRLGEEHWNRDSTFDLLAPIVATTIVSVVFWFFVR